MPSGPWNLWAAAVRASTPSAGKSTGSLPTAWVASVWSEDAVLRQMAASFGDWLKDAGFVAGEHDADEAGFGVEERGGGRGG